MNALLPTYRGCVNAWDCDMMGHLNVQHYLGRSSEAVDMLAIAFGLGPAEVRRRRLTLMPVRDRVVYKRELRAGDVFAMHSAVRAVEDETIATHTEMVNLETGRPAATFERISVPWDLEAGRPCPWPDDIRAAAERLAIPAEALPRLPGPQGPAAPGPDFEHLIETHRGAFGIWETDVHGHVTPRFQIVRFSNSMVQFTRHVGISDEMRFTRNLGLAALDYDLTYHRPLTPKDPILVRSGPIEIRDSVLRFGHQMVHAATGEPLTSLSFILAIFDLEKRKIVPVPLEVRQAAQPLCPPAH